MKITRRSIVSGAINTLEIDCTLQQISLWKRGMLIQDAMPHLTPPQREFILSGITPEEWAELFDMSCPTCDE